MKLVYQITGEDLVNAAMARPESEATYRRNRMLRAVIGSGIIVLMGVMVSHRFNLTGWEIWFIFGIALGSYLLFTFSDDRAQQRRALLAAVKKSRRGDGAVEIGMELGEAALVIVSPDSRTELAYAGIEKIEHGAEESFVYTSPLMRHVIVHRRVVSGELAEFMNELARRCRAATAKA